MRRTRQRRKQGDLDGRVRTKRQPLATTSPRATTKRLYSAIGSRSAQRATS